VVYTARMTAARVGDLLSRLDTPSMLVDLPAMERNIARFMQRFRGGAVSVRPHAKTVKSPVLARLLLDAGARGVCVAKLSEAEVMAEGGIDDILITTEIVGEQKLERLVRLLAVHPKIKLVIDDAGAASALDAALCQARLTAQVLIDVDVGQRRTGVLPGAPALALARHCAGLQSLRLVGLQGYEGHLQQLADASEREARCRAALSLLVDTAKALRDAGFAIDVVTTGGTGTAEICARHPGITEVQPGSFVFMDATYRKMVGEEYECALTISSTVLSRPRACEAVIDAGLKSLSTDSGFAEPKTHRGLRYRPAGDEHGILSWDTEGIELEIGERIELIPSHIDTTINLHDAYYAYRDDRIEAIWAVAARGKVQ
jgi:D-serine deaminase-like pyridoxal phosphate-dependent protein